MRRAIVRRGLPGIAALVTVLLWGAPLLAGEADIALPDLTATRFDLFGL